MKIPLNILIVPPEILAERAEIHHWEVYVVYDDDIAASVGFHVLGTADFAFYHAMVHYRRGKPIDICMRAVDTDPIVP